MTWNWESRDAIKTKPPDQLINQLKLMSEER